MSQIAYIQCLFCQHLNPSDADYCDSCDGQLNLQPCDRCGAVDHRTAKNCYKCGSKFPSPGKPQYDRLLTPAIAGVHDRPTHAQLERPSTDKMLLPQTWASATPVRRGMPVGVVAMLLVLAATVVFVYLYRGDTEHRAQTLGPQESVVEVPGAGQSRETATANRAAGWDASSTPAAPVRMPPGNANSPAKPSSTKQAASPLPASSAEMDAPQDQAVAEKCLPAVAALGLCNLDNQQKRP